MLAASIGKSIIAHRWQTCLRTLFTTKLMNEKEHFRREPYQSGKLTDIGTRRIFSSEHDIFRESVRRFFNEHVVPNTVKWEEAGQVDRECWTKAGEAGLLAVSIPEDKGGLGGDWLSSVIVQEEQCYCNSTGPGYLLHSDIMMPYIAKYGTKEQISKYMPDLTAGRNIGAIAMTEPNAGSDLQGIRTTAKRDGDEWVINGSKTFITNGYLSDVVIVAALTDTNAKSAAHGLTLFIVDKNSPGFKKGRILKKLGLKGQDTCELFFEDCRVPFDAVLGGEAGLNKGFQTLMRELPQERLLIANVSIAASEFMFEETREYVKQRKAFGRRIADLQTIQHKLAELKTEIAATRAFVDQCNELHNVGKLDNSTASMAKYWASEKVNFQAYDFVQMFGGAGYMWEYPLAKTYVDVRVHPIYGGSNEIMKELISRQIVEE
uniref:long-chain specific acyl-CoA dehydrogenase, mitochondrial-like n=1 Tax=Styela clava TaxID=7725 RepID=UPI0019395DE7|nr:long-chain specific acyl-CoA dehydrogenase, mitochondrial-like [Styela clava]